MAMVYSGGAVEGNGGCGCGCAVAAGCACRRTMGELDQEAAGAKGTRPHEPAAIVDDERVAELAKVCERMDAVLLECFRCSEELKHTRDSFHGVWKSALFNMAQARYDLGATSITRLQYHSNMTANTLVRKEGDKWVSTSAPDEEYVVLGDGEELEEEDDEDETEFEALLKCVKEGKEISEETGGLRRRHVRPGSDAREARRNRDGDGGEAGEREAILEEEAKKQREREQRALMRRRRPLQWFGAMPPRTLRVAQEEFKDSLEHVLEMASAVHRFQLLEREYAELRQRKAELQPRE